jgi:adenosine deaminase
VTTLMNAVVGALLLIGGDPGWAQEPPWGAQVRSREEAVHGRLEGMGQGHWPLRALLQEMPKGADLHSHLPGAVQSERLIEWGAEDGVCVSTATFTATPPPCS